MDLDFGPEYDAFREEVRAFLKSWPLQGDAEHVDYPKFDKEKAELEAFAAACSGGPAYPLPTDDAIHGVAVFEAIVESALSDNPVEIA